VDLEVRLYEGDKLANQPDIEDQTYDGAELTFDGVKEEPMYDGDERASHPDMEENTYNGDEEEHMYDGDECAYHPDIEEHDGDVPLHCEFNIDRYLDPNFIGF